MFNTNQLSRKSYNKNFENFALEYANFLLNVILTEPNIHVILHLFSRVGKKKM